MKSISFVLNLCLSVFASADDNMARRPIALIVTREREEVFSSCCLLPLDLVVVKRLLVVFFIEQINN